MGLFQLAIKMKDQPGELAKFTKMLNDNNININSITVSQIPGLVLFIVDKTKECIDLLNEGNYEFSKKEIICVLLPNNPTSSEEIEKVAKVLGDNDVNIDFLYTSFLKKSPLMVLHVSDVEKAKEVLKSSGLYLFEM